MIWAAINVEIKTPLVFMLRDGEKNHGYTAR